MALIEVHVHGNFSAIEHKLDLVLANLERTETTMTQELENVNAALARVETAVAVELQQLADALTALASKDNPAAIQAIADRLSTLAGNLEADDPVPVPTP